MIRTLRVRLAVVFAALVAAVFVVDAVYTSSEQAAFVEQALRDHAVSVALLAARSGESPADRPAADPIRPDRDGPASLVARNADSMSIERISTSGTVLEHITAAGSEARGSAPATARRLPGTSPAVEVSDFAIVGWAKARDDSGETWIRVEVDRRRADEVRAHVFRDALIAGLLCLVVILIAGSIALAGPVRALRQAADFTRHLDATPVRRLRLDDRSIEIKRIESALNTAARRLAERREALLAGEKRFRRMVENLCELVFEVDADFMTEYLGPAWESLKACPAETLLGKSLATLLSDDAEQAVDLESRLRALNASADQTASLEVSLCAADGDRRWFRVRLKPRVEHGTVTGYTGAARDITAIRLHERRPGGAKDPGAEAAGSKNAFMGTMSHELRTPMNAIIGMTDLVLESQLNGEQRQLLTHVRSAADELLGIINEILDYSKIETGRLDFERIPFELLDCVQQAVAAYTDAAEAKGLFLDCRVDPTVPDALEGDPHRLRQVLQILIGNGVKFTKAGHVVVRVTVDRISGDDCVLRFAVEDTGIGIAPTDQERIFEAFTQADGSPTRSHGGTGLGLAIASRLAELMRGRIDVASTPGTGSTFVFTAHFVRRDDRPSDPGEPVIDDLRIMVVGESEYETGYLADALGGWQLMPDSESVGSQVIARLRKATSRGSPIQVLVINDRTQDLEASELARSLRGDPAIRQPAIVLVASSGQRGDGALCRQVGIDAYLTRPIHALDLLDAILRAASGRREGRLITRHSLREQRRSLQILVAVPGPEDRVTAMLEKLGHVAHAVYNGVEAVESCHAAHFDLVVLDALLESPDAMTVLVRLRALDQELERQTAILALVPDGYGPLVESLESAGASLCLRSPPTATAMATAIRRLNTPLPAPKEPPERAPSGLSPLPVLNRERALALLDGDEALLEQMVAVYLESEPHLRERLRSAILEGDLRAAHAAIHAIGGSVGSFMAEATLAATARVESGCRSASAADVADHLDALWREMDRLAVALREMPIGAQAGPAAR